MGQCARKVKVVTIVRSSRPKTSWAISILPTLLLYSASALAYIDPNAGGWLFQMLMPMLTAAAGAWLVLRRWIAARLQSLLRHFRRRDNP